jgi:DNA-binding beta-propeller fold protein YncE
MLDARTTLALLLAVAAPTACAPAPRSGDGRLPGPRVHGSAAPGPGLQADPGPVVRPPRRQEPPAAPAGRPTPPKPLVPDEAARSAAAAPSVQPAALLFPGFSVAAPAGDGWRAVTRLPDGPYRAMFVRQTGDPSRVVRAVVAAVVLPAHAATGEALLRRVQRAREEEASRPPYRPVAFASQPDPTPGAPCLRYRMTAEERDADGSPRLLDMHGLWCLHPDTPSYVINVEYNERRRPEAPTIGPGGDGEAFLGSLAFRPLGVRVTAIPIGTGPLGLAATSEGVYVSLADGTVARVDPATNLATLRVRVGEEPTGVLAAGGGIWVALRGEAAVVRLHPATGAIERRVTVARGPTMLAEAGGALWVSETDAGSVARIDLSTGKVTARLSLGGEPSGLAGDGDTLWVAVTGDDVVARIDARRARVTATVAVGRRPENVSVHAGTVWVSNLGGDTMTLLDARTAAPMRDLSVPGHPTGVVSADGRVWVAAYDRDALLPLDPLTGEPAGEPVPVGRHPAKVEAAHGTIWVTGAGDGTLCRLDMPRSGSR